MLQERSIRPNVKKKRRLAVGELAEIKLQAVVVFPGESGQVGHGVDFGMPSRQAYRVGQPVFVALRAVSHVDPVSTLQGNERLATHPGAGLGGLWSCH